MLDILRDRIHRALTSSTGDTLSAVRVPKAIARSVNVSLGSPICSREESAKRRAAAERLAALRAGIVPETKVSRRAEAPVLVYFEKGRNERELGRIREVLDAKRIGYELLDLAGDETTLSFVTNKARCEADELPVVFVADAPIGNFQKLVASDVSGELERLVRGAR